MMMFTSFKVDYFTCFPRKNQFLNIIKSDSNKKNFRKTTLKRLIKIFKSESKFDMNFIFVYFGLLMMTRNAAAFNQDDFKVDDLVTLIPRNNNIVLFHRIGSLITAMDFANIQVDINANEIGENMESFIDDFYTAANKISDPAKNKSLVMMGKDLVTKKILINELCDLDPLDKANKLSRRSKRSPWPALAVFTSLIDSGIGLHALNQAEKAQDMAVDNRRFIMEVNSAAKLAINQQAEQLKSLAIAVQKSTNSLISRMDELEAYTMLMEIARSYLHWIDETVNGIQHLVNGQLLQTFLDDERLHIAFDDLLDRIKSMGYQTIDKLNLLDVFSLPYSVSKNQNGLKILIHVPIFFPDSILKIYKYDDIPWYSKDSDGSTMATTATMDDKIIAVDDKRQDHQILNEMELHKCHVIKNHYICGQHRLFLKSIRSSCIGSIFSGDFQFASQQCPLRVEPAREQAFQTGNGKFRVMVPKPLLAQMRCRNDRIDSITQINGIYDLHVPEGCRFDVGRLSIRRSPVQGLRERFDLRLVSTEEFRPILDKVETLLLNGSESVNFSGSVNGNVSWFDDSKYELFEESHIVRDTMIFVSVALICGGILIGVVWYILRPTGWLAGKWEFLRNFHNERQTRLWKIKNDRFDIERQQPPGPLIAPPPSPASGNGIEINNNDQPQQQQAAANIDPQFQLADVVVEVVNDFLSANASHRPI